MLLLLDRVVMHQRQKLMGGVDGASPQFVETAVPRQLFAAIPESGSGGLRFRSRSLPPAGSLYCGFGLKSFH